MAEFVDALVHAELFLLGVNDTQEPAPATVSPPATPPASTTISFSADDYRSAAG
ncbi:hypothetical protein [Bordetella petrii]|uniref:hypothetical protein n=1 Tax=Bordetella petrii TaxID=94624 RepID=UPI001E355697|nr:hypothetical protein [Bordetella petrii]MCD0501691.1 hypothetical protein [Bordetella petrii]